MPCPPPKKKGLWGNIVNTWAITVSFPVLLYLINPALIHLICRLLRGGEQLCGHGKSMGRYKVSDLWAGETWGQSRWSQDMWHEGKGWEMWKWCGPSGGWMEIFNVFLCVSSLEAQQYSCSCTAGLCSNICIFTVQKVPARCGTICNTRVQEDVIPTVKHFSIQFV